ncbi:MAG: DUF2283 domain-containing protein [Chloroflexi bacterium]|nr:DUF2283 domain-containing protein [Chloroflexota bacterium]
MAAPIAPTLVEELLALPTRQVWSEYDAEADVLYLSFRKPQQANDLVMEADGNVYHYRDDTLVGVTILNASTKISLNEA